MSLLKFLVLVPMCVAGSLLQCQTSKPADRPVESEHIAGPQVLEGWTLKSPLPDDQNAGARYPFTLVIARNGRVIRRIKGNAFIWNWTFLKDGRRIAYESGPLHFGLQCELYDLKTGRVLDSIDCFHGIPENAPAWLVALEGSR